MLLFFCAVEANRHATFLCVFYNWNEFAHLVCHIRSFIYTPSRIFCYNIAAHDARKNKELALTLAYLVYVRVSLSFHWHILSRLSLSLSISMCNKAKQNSFFFLNFFHAVRFLEFLPCQTTLHRMHIFAIEKFKRPTNKKKEEEWFSLIYYRCEKIGTDFMHFTWWLVLFLVWLFGCLFVCWWRSFSNNLILIVSHLDICIKFSYGKVLMESSWKYDGIELERANRTHARTQIY